ncbi:hypothetical protein CYY_009324 [Polysphondylium violaceum]|uniref:U1-C C2H2-type zinc finger domain-containing protein n=1 Tax=Polysphondylium violaceum TaxID=133409 RepID=A0A8J4PLV4_9MYCE|nr:hypothetical protein CYY_009324 [Polysphondylium violaceum]
MLSKIVFSLDYNSIYRNSKKNNKKKKSSNNNKHWCNYCKIFIQPNPSSIKSHEEGWKHKNAASKFIADQSRAKKNDDREKKKELFEIQKIQDKAAKSYREKDLGRDLERKKLDLQKQQLENLNHNDYYQYYQVQQQQGYFQSCGDQILQQQQHDDGHNQLLSSSYQNLYAYYPNSTLSSSTSSLANSQSSLRNSSSSGSGSNLGTSTELKKRKNQDDSPTPSKYQSRDRDDLNSSCTMHTSGDNLNELLEKKKRELIKEKITEKTNNQIVELEVDRENYKEDKEQKEDEEEDEEDEEEDISKIDNGTTPGGWEVVESHQSAFGSTREASDEEEEEQDNNIKNNKNNDYKNYSDPSGSDDSEEEMINMNKRANSNMKSKNMTPTTSTTTTTSNNKSTTPTTPISKLSFNLSKTVDIKKDPSPLFNTDSSIPDPQHQDPPAQKITLTFNKPVKQRNIRKTVIEDKQA